MSSSIFDDKSIKPDADSLVKVLGTTSAFWESIKKHLESEYGELIEEWKYYGKKSGWLLKTLRKKRNLFFLIPLQGCYRIVFVFADKAVSAVENSDLPEHIIEELKNARKYAEGRGLQIDVRGPEDLENIKTSRD